MMAAKTDTEVLIGGKVFTLSGYESEEYLQKVASYINNKMSEYSKIDGFRRQPLDTQNVLLQLNIADDYFKAKKQISILEEDIAAKEKELYDLKHELIAAQIKLESTEKTMKTMQTELNENAKSMVRMETELKEYHKKAEIRK
ncbi:MAG: cell division protein ZapA [Lachnospiraceae bacterium]|nr:cell division protein ZapA [Lachnospiraceae bacterium]